MHNKEKNKNRLVQFRVSDREWNMLTALCERFGARTSEYVRGLLHEKFLKVFPKYTEKKGRENPALQEEDLTDEQFCEMWGGKVMRTDAGYVCRQSSGGGTYSNLVSNREGIKANGKMIAGLKKL